MEEGERDIRGGRKQGEERKGRREERRERRNKITRE